MAATFQPKDQSKSTSYAPQQHSFLINGDSVVPELPQDCANEIVNRSAL
jgi:hypothetical protein